MASYKVVRTCHGFRGQKWLEGQIAHGIDPSENPPRHFVPLDQVPKAQPPSEPHRTEPREMLPGQNRGVPGGFAHSTSVEEISRQSTTDQLPNQNRGPEPPPRDNQGADQQSQEGQAQPPTPEQPAQPPAPPQEGGEAEQKPAEPAPTAPAEGTAQGPTDAEMQAEADA